ncbi:MAG: ABC transporter substrate-binding protein [Thermomicrobiales bacterium]
MQAPPATPADGLHLVLAGPATGVSTLDPALVRDNQTMTIVRQLFRGLLAFDATLTPQPALAASVDADDQETSFRVILRPDGTFHDGRPITARDVEASLARALNPATAGGDRTALAAAGQLGGIRGAGDVLAGRTDRLGGVEVMSDRQLQITLDGPDAAFPGKLASVAASIVDATGSYAIAMNGTGPFSLASVPSGESLTMNRRGYYDHGHSTVSMLSFVTGSAAAMPGNLLQAGSIDLASGLPSDQAVLLADPASGAGDVRVTAMPEFSLLYLALSPLDEALADLSIRRAIQVGFPWQRLAESATGVQPAQGIIAPGMLGRDWPANLPPFDLERAKAEIARSRFGSADRVPPITVYTGQTSAADPLRNVGVAMQEFLGEQLGLRIEPVSVAWDDFLAGLPAGRFPTYSLTWIADFPDPSSFLEVLFGAGSPDNYTGHASSALDGLLTEARSAADDERRATLFARAQQVLIDEALVMPISFDIGYTAYRMGIGGVPISPIGLVGLETVVAT